MVSKVILGVGAGIVVGFVAGLCLPEERKPKVIKDIRDDIAKKMEASRCKSCNTKKENSDTNKTED